MLVFVEQPRADSRALLGLLDYIPIVFFPFLLALNRSRETSSIDQRTESKHHFCLYVLFQFRGWEWGWNRKLGEEEEGRKRSIFAFIVSPIFDELLGLARWPVHSLSYLLHVGQACFSSSSPPPEAITSPARRRGGCHHFFHRTPLDLEFP